MQMTGISAGAAILPEAVSAVVMRLLVDADEAMDADWAAAKSCIAQATALLQAEYDGLAQPAETAKPAAATLAGWQIARVKTHLDQHLETQIRVWPAAGEVARQLPGDVADARGEPEGCVAVEGQAVSAGDGLGGGRSVRRAPVAVAAV